MSLDNNKSPIIRNLESIRKNDSKIFKDSKFRPENVKVKKIFTAPDKKEVSLPLQETRQVEGLFGGKSEVSKREIYRNLLKDPAFCEQATKEGKTPWEFAKELIGELPKDFNPLLEKEEIQKQISYYEYYKSLRKKPR